MTQGKHKRELDLPLRAQTQPIGRSVDVYDATGFLFTIKYDTGEAAHIVRCVNNFDDMLAAFKALVAAEMDYGDESNVAVNQALDSARQAIARAELP